MPVGTLKHDRICPSLCTQRLMHGKTTHRDRWCVYPLALMPTAPEDPCARRLPLGRALHASDHLIEISSILKLDVEPRQAERKQVCVAVLEARVTCVTVEVDDPCRRANPRPRVRVTANRADAAVLNCDSFHRRLRAAHGVDSSIAQDQIRPRAWGNRKAG